MWLLNANIVLRVSDGLVTWFGHISASALVGYIMPAVGYKFYWKCLFT